MGRLHRTCGEKKHHVDIGEKEIIELVSQPGVSQVSKLIRGDLTDKLKREMISSHLRTDLPLQALQQCITRAALSSLTIRIYFESV